MVAIAVVTESTIVVLKDRLTMVVVVIEKLNVRSKPLPKVQAVSLIIYRPSIKSGTLYSMIIFVECKLLFRNADK